MDKELKQLDTWQQVEDFYVDKMVSSLRNSMPRDPAQIEVAKREIRVAANPQVEIFQQKFNLIVDL